MERPGLPRGRQEAEEGIEAPCAEEGLRPVLAPFARDRERCAAGLTGDHPRRRQELLPCAL